MTHSSHLVYEGYVVKVEGTTYCVSNDRNHIPAIFLNREEAEAMEMDFHKHKYNQYIETSVVKVKIEEIEDEDICRDRQRRDRDNRCSEGRELPCFHRNTNQKRTELH